MARRCFIAVLTLTIALQSVAFSADMDLQHYAVMPHAAHSHVSAALKNDDPTTKRAPVYRGRSADHCHHSHVCFHMALMVSVADTFGVATGITPSDYQASITAGMPSSLLRPPIS